MPQSQGSKDSRGGVDLDEDEDDRSVLSLGTTNSGSTKNSAWTPGAKPGMGRSESRDRMEDYYAEQAAKLNNTADSPETLHPVPATPTAAPTSALKRAMFAVSSFGAQATPTFSQRTMDIVSLGRRTGAKISDIMNQIEDIDSKVLRRGESTYFRELLGDAGGSGSGSGSGSADDTNALMDTPCKDAVQ